MPVERKASRSMVASLVEQFRCVAKADSFAGFRQAGSQQGPKARAQEKRNYSRHVSTNPAKQSRDEDFNVHPSRADMAVES